MKYWVVWIAFFALPGGASSAIVIVRIASQSKFAVAWSLQNWVRTGLYSGIVQKSTRVRWFASTWNLILPPEASIINFKSYVDLFVLFVITALLITQHNYHVSCHITIHTFFKLVRSMWRV